MYVKALRVVPFVRMVAVCNNLAFGKVDKDSDIDLFVVAKKGRLFMVRFFVTLIFQILGVRRYGKKVAGRFCLSFYVDDSKLNLSKIALKKDIYLAFWIRSMLPLIDDGVSGELLEANAWARDYFERERDYRIDDSEILAEAGFVREMFAWLLGGKFGDFIEDKMMIWQLRRAHKKAGLADRMASLVINEHMLKFHNVDRRRAYRNKWFKQYGRDAKLTDERFFLL